MIANRMTYATIDCGGRPEQRWLKNTPFVTSVNYAKPLQDD